MLFFPFVFLFFPRIRSIFTDNNSTGLCIYIYLVFYVVHRNVFSIMLEAKRKKFLKEFFFMSLLFIFIYLNFSTSFMRNFFLSLRRQNKKKNWKIPGATKFHHVVPAFGNIVFKHFSFVRIEIQTENGATDKGGDEVDKYAFVVIGTMLLKRYDEDVGVFFCSWRSTRIICKTDLAIVYFSGSQTFFRPVPLSLIFC